MPRNNVHEWYMNLTPEERAEQSSKAGKASSENRQKKKLLREYLEAILEKKTAAGTLYDEITIALIEKAMEGDVSAYNTIRDTLGQKPKDQVELSANDTINISIGEDNESDKPDNQ